MKVVQYAFAIAMFPCIAIGLVARAVAIGVMVGWKIGDDLVDWIFLP